MHEDGEAQLRVVEHLGLLQRTADRRFRRASLFVPAFRDMDHPLKLFPAGYRHADTEGSGIAVQQGGPAGLHLEHEGLEMVEGPGGCRELNLEGDGP